MRIPKSIILAFLWATCSLSPGAEVGAVCVPQLLVEPQVIWQSNVDADGVEEQELLLRDPLDPRFYFKTTLRGRTLSFCVHLKESNEDRSVLRGSELLKMALSSLAGRFDVISNVWTEGDNYNVFNRAILDGHSAQEAVRMTWTGRQMQLHGFTVVSRVTAAGQPGRYRFVIVDFAKPSN